MKGGKGDSNVWYGSYLSLVQPVPQLGTRRTKLRYELVLASL